MEPEISEKDRKKQETKEWAQALTIAVIATIIIRLFVFEFVVVEQTSMYPTLCPGEKLCLLKVAYLFDAPDYGDIIVFKDGDDDNKDLVKRVIATGGQTVSISGNKVYVDGEALEEIYVPSDEYSGDFGPITVPEGSIFVMGDNRDGSMDSREFGSVSEDRVKGRIVFRLKPFTVFKRF